MHFGEPVRTCAYTLAQIDVEKQIALFVQNGENKNSYKTLSKMTKNQVQHFANFYVRKILSLELIKCKYREKSIKT